MDQADQADQADQMDLQPTNIVWLKRDFRLQDHAPLRAAEEDIIPYYIVYFLEPSLIHSPDTSLRHLQFAYGSIMEMNRQLESKLESKKM
jgi:deoxyribodipyrimidine photo-lyase